MKKQKSRAAKSPRRLSVTVPASAMADMMKWAEFFEIPEEEGREEFRRQLVHLAKDLADQWNVWGESYTYPDRETAERVAKRFFQRHPRVQDIDLWIEGEPSSVRFENPDWAFAGIIKEQPKHVPVSLSMTPDMAEIFQPAADNSKASLGELLLALACDRLTIEPDAPHSAVWEVESALWSYPTGRFCPAVAQNWKHAGFKVRDIPPAEEPPQVIAEKGGEPRE